MIKHCFFILMGALASSQSFAQECKSSCFGTDYYERRLVERCHHDCVESCSTIRVEKNSPRCIGKIRSEIKFLNDLVDKAESSLVEVIEINQL